MDNHSSRPAECKLYPAGRLMLEAISLIIVVTAGLYLAALGAAALLMPNEAIRFLNGFASSARLHYFELTLRLITGFAFVTNAPRMQCSVAFGVFGWVLLATTMCLLALPWRWHSQFAQYAVPKATQYITMIGICSLVLGGIIWVAAALPIAG